MSNKSVKLGIFGRIFLIYTIVVFLAFLFIEFYITGAVRESYINHLTENLVVQAKLIEADVSFNGRPSLDALCAELKEKTGSRITIIATDGTVLGDSDKESDLMENHGHRPEILEALRAGSGMTIRHSATLNYDFLYTAVKVVKDGKLQGYIRMAVPLNHVDAAVNALRIKIIIVVCFVLLATGVFSIWQLDRVRRLTQMIRDFSTSIVRGGFGKRLFIDSAGEFNDIAESLNTMSVELQKSITESEEEKNRLNVILRNIPDALLITDARDVIQLSSSASRTFFGDTPVRGKHLIEVVRNRDFLALMNDVRKNLAEGTSEFKLDHPVERFLVARVAPLWYRKGEVSGFVAIFHDITQLKKLEETRKDFVANISHEIKTPITAIRGFADTLLEGALSDKENALKFLETIKSNSERINNLVDDLMTISKIELGVIKVEKSAVDFQEVADHVLTLLRDKAAAKNLTLQTQILPDPRTVAADRDRLIQILTNLVDNAIKFTEKGGVKLGNAEENSTAYIYVEDTGVGIPEKHLPRLGERFYRVDPGRSRSMGGTGLGLAIVKHLVKAHGWDMQIESTPGKGTRVKIFVV